MAERTWQADVETVRNAVTYAMHLDDGAHPNEDPELALPALERLERRLVEAEVDEVSLAEAEQMLADTAYLRDESWDGKQEAERAVADLLTERDMAAKTARMFEARLTEAEASVAETRAALRDLRIALSVAIDHLRYNEWKGDRKNVRRTAALRELESLSRPLTQPDA